MDERQIDVVGVPEDLRNGYELAKKGLAVIAEWHEKNQELVQSPLSLMVLIERISRLERENEELRAKVARLYRPIDDAEWEQFHGYEFGFKVLHRREANALIRARLAAAQGGKK